MRATRNASKSTPPPPKKSAKGTKSPAVEKKENVPNSEAMATATVNAASSTGKPEAVATAPLGINASSATNEEAAITQLSKEEKVDAVELEAGKEEKTTDLVVEIPQEAEACDSKPQAEGESMTRDKTEDDFSTKDIQVIPNIPKPEVFQVADEVVKDAMEDVSEQAEALAGGADIKASDVVEEQREDSKALEGGADQEMKGAREDKAEDDLNTDTITDNAEDEEGADNGDEGNDDEEGDEEEDEESEDDVAEPKLVNERLKHKKHEVFVGGLHKDATEEEVKKVFEAIGEVVELRLMRNPQSGKNKGYAFVQFATAEQATRAVTELDKTKIRDRECAVVPSEDNTTLFVGNICKSWKLEQVQEKLKGYGVEAIEEITLVEDPENEGHHKGHAFLEFETRSDASKAFKRLSKPDAVFGCDRSARVAWAEGVMEPDETMMAKVKSVFVNGMPTEWDDSKIEEHFGKFGSIDRIVLAKNIPRSKREDYAFVNFSTRDAALAAIEALNDIELVDGDKKMTLKVQLAKPPSRKKRTQGHRGAYLVGGPPPKKSKSKDAAQGGDREGRRAMSRGDDQGGYGSSQKKFKGGVKRKVAEERPLPKERLQNKRQRGPTVGAAGHQRGRGNRVGTSSSRRGRPSEQSDDDEYLPPGARMSPVFAATRGFSGRAPPREVAYPSRSVERGYGYSRRRGAERLYPTLDEEAVYHGGGERGYPRTHMEYVESTLGAGSLYPESLRSAPLGRTSVGGHILPPIRGSHGYAPVLSRGADYNGYLPAATDVRGAYPSAYYGSRAAGLGPYY